MNTDKANRLHQPRVVVSPDCLEGPGKSLFREVCCGVGVGGCQGSRAQSDRQLHLVQVLLGLGWMRAGEKPEPRDPGIDFQRWLTLIRLEVPGCLLKMQPPVFLL